MRRSSRNRSPFACEFAARWRRHIKEFIHEFWLKHTHWFFILVRLSAIVASPFLLVLAGLAFARLFRHPRTARWFLAAIGIWFVLMWVADRVFEFAIKLSHRLGLIGGNGWTSHLVGGGYIIIGVVLTGATWWCLMHAVFDGDEPPRESGDTAEETR